MRHKKAIRRLGRNKAQRKSLLRNLAINFFQHKEIVTTEAKAKELKKTVEKMITHAKKQDIAGLRLINSFLNHPATTAIVKDLGLRFRDRKGGYTRILKLGRRKGDAGETVVIQLVS